MLTTFKCPNLLEESYQSAAHVFFHFPVSVWEDFLGCLERHQTAHRIYKCSCNSSAKASSSTWLVESRGNINKKCLKITAKSSKVQSFTNKHPTSQDISSSVDEIFTSLTVPPSLQGHIFTLQSKRTMRSSTAKMYPFLGLASSVSPPSSCTWQGKRSKKSAPRILGDFLRSTKNQ